MSTTTRTTYVCDEPGCHQMLVVNVPEGYWEQAAAQAAENRGWRVTADEVFCEDHDPTMMLRDGERRAAT